MSRYRDGPPSVHGGGISYCHLQGLIDRARFPKQSEQRMSSQPLQTSDSLQELHDAVAALIQAGQAPPQAPVRTRSGVGLGAELATLLIWNLLVAFVVHYGAHVLGHLTCSALHRNRSRLEAGDVQAVGETKALLTNAMQPGLFLAQPPSNSDRVAAIAALKRILLKSGRGESIAGEQAESVVDLLIAHCQAEFQSHDRLADNTNPAGG